MVFQPEEPRLADAPDIQSTPERAAPASPLTALARAGDRAGQQAVLARCLEEEAARLASRSGHQPAARLRLRALLALRPSLGLPTSPLPAGLSSPGARERLVVELSEQLASDGGHALLQARWRADLAAHNPAAAAHPEFARLAEAIDALPALVEGLRDLARAARARRPAPGAAVAALEAAATTLAPERLAGLCEGVPAEWLAALLSARLEPGPHARLAAECDAALEAAGRLRESQQSPTWELAALASVVNSRVCSALALCEELSTA